MRRDKLVRYGVILMLLVAALGHQQAFAAPLAQAAVWNIISPTEGSTVGGVVTIQGTATLPNFDSYSVLYAAGPLPTGTSAWVYITSGVRTMVANGVLATWDTTGIPNGQYTLALAVYEVGNTEPKLHFTNNITLFNQATTPTASPTPEPAPDDTQAGGTPQPTPQGGIAAPGAVIEQPPTATPRPTPTLAADAGASTDGTDESSDVGAISELFSTEKLKEALSLGAQLAVLIYAVGFLYVIAKAVLRYYLRQLSRRESKS